VTVTPHPARLAPALSGLCAHISQHVCSRRSRTCCTMMSVEELDEGHKHMSVFIAFSYTQTLFFDRRYCSKARGFERSPKQCRSISLSCLRLLRWRSASVSGMKSVRLATYGFMSRLRPALSRLKDAVACLAAPSCAALSVPALAAELGSLVAQIAACSSRNSRS
jgi:hypothetical protein